MPPVARRLNHVQILVVDMERSVDFYTTLFGLVEESRDRSEDGSTLVFLRTADDQDVLALQHRPGVDRVRHGGGIDHFGFWVPGELENVLNLAPRHGGEVIGRAPWNPGAFAYLRDPSGYVVEVNGSPA